MKIIKKENGQSLVELSISILILLLLLVGAVEFGMAFFQFVQLRDAAQEGALYGSLHPLDDADIRNRIRSSSDSPVDLADTGAVTITIAYTPTDNPSYACEGSTGGVSHGIQVTVSFDHDVFMPFMTQIVGDTIPLNATVTDTILSPRCP